MSNIITFKKYVGSQRVTVAKKHILAVELDSNYQIGESKSHYSVVIHFATKTIVYNYIEKEDLAKEVYETIVEQWKDKSWLKNKTY